MKVEMKSVKEMVKLYTSGRIDVSMSWQRGMVSAWKKQTRVDMLVDSMLKGYSIQSMHLIELASGMYELLDGKQRMTTIANIIGDVYPVSINGEEPAYFSQWDEENKAKFLAYVIPLIILDLEDSEKREQFERLAGGSPLSGMEKKRGSFVTLMSDLRFKGVVEALQGWGLKIAGNDLSKETIEEITLSALAYVTSGFNGSLGGDLSAQFKDNKPDFNKLSGLPEFLSACGEVEKVKKGFGKKAALGSLLAAYMKYGDKSPHAVENLERFIFDKSLHSEKGIDQKDFTVALASGTGSLSSWNTRVDILGRAIIREGETTPNVVKGDKAPEKEDGRRRPPFPERPRLGTQFYKDWAGRVEVETCDTIERLCISGGMGDPKARIEKTGVLSLAFIDKDGKYKVTPLDQILPLVAYINKK